LKQNAISPVSAFTRVELVVVIAIVIVLASMFVPPSRGKARAQRLMCMSNLREVGVADRLWQETGDQWLAHTADPSAIWSNYANLLKSATNLTPKILDCPSDERQPPWDFKSNFTDNSHISYFFGAGGSNSYPQIIAAGDRNLGPGSVPDPEYGYSPTNGKGADVAVPISGPVSWSLKMHSAGNTAGAGNVLLGDGSVQLVSSSSFSANLLHNSPPTTNWPIEHLPAVPSIRLIFP